MKLLLPIFGLCSLVKSHFLITVPAGRGNPDAPGAMEGQKVGPCGYDGLVPNVPRAAYSESNGEIELFFFWNGDNDIYVGVGDNPKTFPYKVGELAGAKQGKTYKVPFDIKKVPGLKKGDPFTIQVICHQKEDPKRGTKAFDIYQCTDFTYDVNPAPVDITTSVSVGPTSTITQVDSTKTVTTTSETPKPTNSKFKSTQSLADSLVEHISIPGGCNQDPSHMPEDAPSVNLAALWIRGSFHDAGLWDPLNETYPFGDGSTPFFLENKENFGLGASIATQFVPPTFYNHSRSDIIALAGHLTVTHCGGPAMPFRVGREDVATPVGPEGRIPDDSTDSYSKMKARLQQLGFNNEDIVVLVTGSHSMGGVHQKISPHATKKKFEPFDNTPGVFDNDIFKNMMKGKCILNIDCGIMKDPELIPLVKLYAEDQQKFFDQYSISFQKMLNSRHKNLMSAIHLKIDVQKNLIEEGGVDPEPTTVTTNGPQPTNGNGNNGNQGGNNNGNNGNQSGSGNSNGSNNQSGNSNAGQYNQGGSTYGESSKDGYDVKSSSVRHFVHLAIYGCFLFVSI
ncbi:heme peroxidase [Globomyces pollinis-pini]|nr:heme peroxidase [Globomyces pollinis-pini]